MVDSALAFPARKGLSDIPKAAKPHIMPKTIHPMLGLRMVSAKGV